MGQNTNTKPDFMAYACNPSTWEVLGGQKDQVFKVVWAAK